MESDREWQPWGAGVEAANHKPWNRLRQNFGLVAYGQSRYRQESNGKNALLGNTVRASEDAKALDRGILRR
jgi:hypothetical protein